MEFGILNISLLISLLLLMLATIFTLFRLLSAKSVYDRIVSLDLVASVVMGFILLYSIAMENAIYFDVVIVISLIAFIGTVSISAYLKNKE